MEKLISDIKNNSHEYGSIPFWSWNDRLNKDDLIRQIRDMKDIEMSGFFMHARSGLETEYLSDEWYDCIKACVEEAEKLGMEAWAYDENGWPSGFAGGKLLTGDENYAHYLEYSVENEYPADAFAVYILNDNNIEKVDSPVDGIDEYHCIYRKYDESYVDTMNPRITKEFIDLTHNDYKEKLGEKFGKSMPGFFTDEPQYYRWRTIWSDTLPVEFKKHYGYDVFSALLALFIDFDGAREFRYDYYKLCHELFIENFMGVMYKWCKENNCKITGHAVEEKFLGGQMWCCGGVMPFYEYMDIPGVDYLGKGIGTNDLSSKQVGSVAAQLGKKKVLSEMFAYCGWDVTPLELKRIAEHQYYGGVNLMCQHLYPYSLRGQRKRDYPAFYSEHQPWQKALRDFNIYFNRLGYLLSKGEEKANTLVIHPMHSAYLDFKRNDDRNSIAELEQGLDKVTNFLSQNQVAYHFGDENLMKKYARVDKDKLIIGNCTYDYIVIPLLYTLDGNTAKLLKSYLSNGGKLCIFEGMPDRIDGRLSDLSWLVPNTSIDDILNQREVLITEDGNVAPLFRVMVRHTDEGRLFYILNLAKKTFENIDIRIKNCNELSVINLESLEYYGVDGKITDGYFTFNLPFEAVESYVLIEKKTDVKKPNKPKEIKLNNLKLKKMPQNAFTLDYACLSYDGINYGKLSPIVQIKDNLLHEKYSGKIYLKYIFDVSEIPQSLNLAFEPLNYEYIKINGSDVKPNGGWWLDRSFQTTDIHPYIKTGTNEIIMSIDYYQRDYVYYVLYSGVSESLRNCLNFDTEIESVYLFGNFEVLTDKDKFTEHERNVWTYDGSFKIKAQYNISDFSNLIKNGYPFFTGDIELTADYCGDGTELTIEGYYSVAEIYVNGTMAKRLLFKNHCDLSEWLKEGKNEINIKLYNSNRNLLGPHHYIDAEPYAVPDVFSFEKQWNEDKCDYYLDRYSLVRFGVIL